MSFKLYDVQAHLPHAALRRDEWQEQVGAEQELKHSPCCSKIEPRHRRSADVKVVEVLELRI